MKSNKLLPISRNKQQQEEKFNINCVSRRFIFYSSFRCSLRDNVVNMKLKRNTNEMLNI